MTEINKRYTATFPELINSKEVFIKGNYGISFYTLNVSSSSDYFIFWGAESNKAAGYIEVHFNTGEVMAILEEKPPTGTVTINGIYYR